MKIQVNLEGEGLTPISLEAIREGGILLIGKEEKMKIKKILVVEDDSLMRELIVEIVKEEGIEVIEASNAKDGWWKFQGQRPDLVITDLQMEAPDSGRILLQKIKGVSPSTPVILVRGVEGIEKKEADCLFLKPFDHAVFQKVVKNFLERR